MKHYLKNALLLAIMVTNAHALNQSKRSCQPLEQPQATVTVFPLAQKSYPCIYTACFQVFSSKKKLAKHKQDHVQKSFPCPHCPKGYSQSDTLQTHIDVMHNKILLHPCPICGRPHAQAQDLKKHLGAHARGKVNVTIKERGTPEQPLLKKRRIDIDESKQQKPQIFLTPENALAMLNYE